MNDPLRKILESSLHEVAKERNYEDYMLDISSVSTGGANYTSKLYRGKITAKNGELHFFSKVASVGEAIRNLMPMSIYYIEQLAYTKLANVFNKLETENNVPKEHRLRMPELYWYNDKNLEEVLLIENLTNDGFETYSRFKSITWDYASRAVEEIAKFHALCFAMAIKYPDDDKEIKEVVKVGEQVEAQLKFTENMIKNGIELTRKENKQTLEKFMNQNMSKVLSMFYGTMRRPTIIHGDFRVSNLMHKVNKEGKYEVVLVDYQTYRTGTVALDLLYFIVSGSDKDFRKKYFHKLIQHYYEQLRLSISRLSLDPNTVFPKEDFDFEIKESMILGLTMALIALPIVTVEEEHAPTLDGDFDVMANIKTSDLCVQRLNDIVDDFIEWGVVPKPKKKNKCAIM